MFSRKIRGPATFDFCVRHGDAERLRGLEVDHQLVSGRRLHWQIGRFAVLVNPSNPLIAEAWIKDAQAAAVRIGRQLEILTAGTNREIDAAFTSAAQKRVDALLVMPDNLFVTRHVQFATQAARHAMPVIYTDRVYADVGGLMSYGTNITDAYRQFGIYVGRVLKGEKPANMPVLQPTKFELVINLETARMLGLAVPPTLLATADEVIE